MMTQFSPTMKNTNQTNNRTARFMLASASLAMLRIAQQLEAQAQHEPNEAKAERLIIMSSDLAHHADAIAEASGWNADTEANMSRFLNR
jgi:DNA-binding protein H-NS